MNKILDLRFVIGVFFTIVGLLLLGYSFTGDIESSKTINQWCGIAFAAFGVLMIVLSFMKDANDELITKN